MRCEKLALIAFLFFLASVALASAQPKTTVGVAQLDEEGKKLCVTCHSSRFPVNNTIYEHRGRVFFDYHNGKSPCFLCHGDSTVGVESDEPTRRPSNAKHPDWDDAAAMGKWGADCVECHFDFNEKDALQAGSIFAPASPPVTEDNLWSQTVAAGICLITGLSLISIVLSVLRPTATKREHQ